MHKNTPLIVGISLPFLMIIAVIGIVYVPSLFVHPQYDFVYTTNSYDYGNCVTVEKSTAPNRSQECTSTTYSVENGKVVESVRKGDYGGASEKLYLYDVKRDSARQVTIDEVKDLSLTTESRSPDGFGIEYKYGHSGIFEIFGGSYGNRFWVLKKGMASKSLSVPSGDGYYGGGDLHFLGWVVQQ